MNRLAKLLVPMAGLAVVTVPALLMTPAVVPADTACAGGICNICPVIAGAISATGTELYCIA